MKSGEIYLASFPFGDTPAAKMRPTLLLTGAIGTGPEVLGAYISSVIPSTPLVSDILLDPTQPVHRLTGLKVISIVRLHKLATIHRASLHRYLGKISPSTQHDVDTILKALLNL